MLAVEKEEAQGEADQQVIAVLEAAATTAAQLEATERSLAQVRGRGRGRGRSRGRVGSKATERSLAQARERPNPNPTRP